MNTIQRAKQLTKDLEHIARVTLFEEDNPEHVEEKILKIVEELGQALDTIKKLKLAHDRLHRRKTGE